MKQRFMMVVLGLLVATAPGCGDGQASPVTVNTVAFTPDGTLVVETNDGLYLFDPAVDGPPKAHFAMQGLPSLRSADQYRYSLSADGTVAAISYSSGDAMTAPIKVVLYHVPSGQVLNQLQVAPPQNGLGSNMLELALAPRGDLMAAVWAAGGEEVDLVMIDTATAGIVWIAPSADRELAGWSVDGTTLYAINSQNVNSALEAYDARAGLKWRQQLAYSAGPVRVAGDGATLVGIATQYPCPDSCLEQYSTWSAADGALLAQQPLPSGVFEYPGAYGGLGNGSFACSTTHAACAIQLEDDGPPYMESVSVYQTTGTVVPPLPSGSAPSLAPTLLQIPRTQASSVALSPDGQFVACSTDTPSWGAGANRVDVYRIAGGQQVASHSFDPPANMH